MVVPSLTISKKKREMKKIFYILASAIVALGAVACENEGLENINPNVGNGEGLSFVATIDAESRVALKGTVNSWELEDKVVINGYTFTCTNAEKGIFSCEKDNVRKDLIGKGELTATYSNTGDGKVDSSAGAKGAVLTATGSFTETVEGVKAEGFNFTLTSALLKFTTTEEVVLAGEGLFNNAKASYTGTDVFVAINAIESTLSYSVDGVQCKSLTKNFEPRKIYNLGELNPDLIYLKPSSDWKSDSATFKAYFFGTAGSVWVDAVDGNKDGTYTALVPNGDYANIIFCRMNPSGANADMWKNVWGQTQDMVVSIGDTCGIAGWNSGVWKTEWNKDNVYLNSMINGDWKTANHFAAWTWPDGGSGSWVKMEKTAKSGLYVVAKSKLKANVLFTAQKNATSSWSVNKQTGDLKTATTNANIYDVNNSAWVTATF